MSRPNEDAKGDSLARQVQANVIAGLIVAAVVATLGAVYSIIRSLSFYEFVVYVALPAAVLGIIASATMLFLSVSNLFLELGARNVLLKQALSETDARLEAAEDRLGRQVAELAYGEVIAEAKRDGWTVQPGKRGQLTFSHPRWGTAASGDDDLDPDRLRLLLSIGRGVEDSRTE